MFAVRPLTCYLSRSPGADQERLTAVQYTIPGIWYLLQRRGWTCQIGARRAIERDDGAVEVRKKETWPRIKARRRPSAAGSSSKTNAASR